MNGNGFYINDLHWLMCHKTKSNQTLNLIQQIYLSLTVYMFYIYQSIYLFFLLHIYQPVRIYLSFPPHIFCLFRYIYLSIWRCPWCNGYRRRKWTRQHKFKSWTRLIAFLIPLGKVWIQRNELSMTPVKEWLVYVAKEYVTLQWMTFLRQ